MKILNKNMKNIHILPTDKPSRLFINPIWEHQLRFVKDELIKKNKERLTQNIYITNDEEIKEGDWCYQVELNNGKVDKCYDVTLYHTWTNNGVDKTRKFKKIILTTDQDLIKDGVQAIDDEFLEWFVKNPSCDEIEVHHFGTCCGNQLVNHCIHCKKYNPVYKIIILKEEPKQKTLTYIKAANKEKRIVNSIMKSKETLEKVAKNYVNKYYTTYAFKKVLESLFIDGAKWQQKRMYSEEDLREAFNNGQDNIDYSEMYGFSSRLTEQEWFEQFKKK